MFRNCKKKERKKFKKKIPKSTLSGMNLFKRLAQIQLICNILLFFFFPDLTDLSI